MYKINGIVKTSRSQIALQLQYRKVSEEQLRQLQRYLNHVEKDMAANGIDISDLNQQSNAALNTLKLMAARFSGEPEKLNHIFKHFHDQQNIRKKTAKKYLVLEFLAAQNLIFKFRHNARVIQIQLNREIVNWSTADIRILAKYIFTLIGKEQPGLQLKQLFLQLQKKLSQSPAVPRKANRLSSIGENYDLQKIFDDLNRIYFNSTISKPELCWSKQVNKRILGTYHAVQNRITINRYLDWPDVPAYVVEGILYHEMLHIKHPTQYCNGRRVIHGRNFKQDEKRFSHYDELKAWIRLFSRKSIKR